MTRQAPDSTHQVISEPSMASGWIQPNQCRNLLVLVESVTAPLLIDHSAPVCLEVDIDVSVPVPCDNTRAADLITAISRQALEAMPDGGDLMITACCTENGVELEIADSGMDTNHRERALPIAAAAVGADLKWQNCPQGGVAVTIYFPAKSAQSRLAA
ncbi:ATPase [Stieleria sp. JC731]|nr:ATPase [Stieleria sp. JC731]MCC9600080.1 ATPase [Stieleria sp. JC731]